MYCRDCGIEIPESSRYCSQCGCTTGKYGFTSQTGKPGRVLRRPRDEKQIAGVCAGVARYLGVDVTLVRVAAVVLALWPPGVGLIAYLVCWIVMPKDPLLIPPPQTTQPQNATIVSQ
jgi:phage shock protein C